MRDEGEGAEVLREDEEAHGEDHVVRGVGPGERCAERVKLR